MLFVHILMFVMVIVGWITTIVLFNSNDRKYNGFQKLLPAIFTTVIFIFFYRPWFHDKIFFLFYEGIWFTLMVLASLVCFLVSLANRGPGSGFLKFFLGIVCCVIIFVSLFHGSFQKKALYKHTKYVDQTELHKTTRARIMPFQVGIRYAMDAFQEPMEKLAHYTVIADSGKILFQAPRVPDGGFIYLKRKMGGVVEVNSETSQKNSNRLDFTMEVSEGIGITDNIRWMLYKKDFFVEIPDSIFYVKDDDKYIAVVPFLKYGFSFPMMYPKFGGVYLVDQTGNVETVPPEKCDTHRLLKDKMFYPEQLNRLEVEAYAYKHGIWNVLFYHREQIEVADCAQGHNPQPYLMETEPGPMWFTSCKPYGNAHGVLKIMTRPANEAFSEVYIKHIAKNSALTGPARFAGYVKNEVQVPDWKSFDIVEPRPVVRSDGLYWMASIVPVSYNNSGSGTTIDWEKSFSGVWATVMFNTDTNVVYAFKEDENVIRFINEEWNMAQMDDFSNGNTFNQISVSKKGGIEGAAEIINALRMKIKQMDSQLVRLEQLIGK